MYDDDDDMKGGLYHSAPGASPWREERLTPVPLVSVSIDATVKNFVASVQMTQKYVNKEKRSLEV